MHRQYSDHCEYASEGVFLLLIIPLLNLDLLKLDKTLSTWVGLIPSIKLILSGLSNRISASLQYSQTNVQLNSVSTFNVLKIINMICNGRVDHEIGDSDICNVQEKRMGGKKKRERSNFFLKTVMYAGRH